MIEEARKSFEDYLKANRKRLEKDTTQVWSLRTEWLLANPQYEEFDLYLRFAWDGEYDEYQDFEGKKVEPQVAMCSGEHVGRTIKHAKGFHVEIVSQDEFDYMGAVIDTMEKAHEKDKSSGDSL